MRAQPTPLDAEAERVIEAVARLLALAVVLDALAEVLA